jgi:tetratricopeptide (TPR) repeat protein
MTTAPAWPPISWLDTKQESPQDTLHWNQKALIRANAVGDDRVRSFYPSLYLNMGHAYEVLGNQAEARKYYELAAEKVNDLPVGPYGDLVRNGISEGHKRISSMKE